MKKGAGFIIENPEGKVLICRATGSDIWSFPKGVYDSKYDDSYLDTAIRETAEETGYIISSETRIEHVGTSKYNHKKKLIYFFFCRISCTFTPECKSFVKPGYPEIDKFKWVSKKKARKKIHYSQKHLIWQERKQKKKYKQVEQYL